jgi:hypothetical protein
VGRKMQGAGLYGMSIAYFLETFWNGFVEDAHLCRLTLFLDTNIERRYQNLSPQNMSQVVG